MKKNIIILTLLAILFLFGSAIAGPEDAGIVPISKWDYKDVDGWGFYAKGGEYSWFGFILRNRGSSDLTVTLPIDVNVANKTRHKIVNTAFKAMINGSVDFLNEAFKKVYFNNSFILPKDSTYAVFFDVTEMERYSSQWDTDVFFSVQIRDQNTEVTLPVKGVLAYDAKNTTPSKLTIINLSPDTVPAAASAAEPLTVTAFCRDLTAKKRTVSFSYSLKNNSGEVIPVELATTLAIEGRSKTSAIRYTGCTSGGSSCESRIKNGIFKLNPGETASFKGTATLPAKPAKSDFFVQTSLRYDYNGKTRIPFLVGYTTGSCSAAPAPAVTPSAPSVVVTPGAGADGAGLATVGFCRQFDSKGKKVWFSYTLKNTSSEAIPVELATSLAVDGYDKVFPISYSDCIADGKSCVPRISSGFISLKAGETAEFRGSVTLTKKPADPNFKIRTSLRYNYGGRKLIPLFVGLTSASCSAGSAGTAPVTDSAAGLVNVSFCRNYDASSRKITFSYALRNESAVMIPVELATTLAVEGFNKVVPIRYTGCATSGSSCASRISGGVFSMNAGETAVFSGEATLPSQPASSNFFVKTSLRYDYKGRTLIPFLVGYTTNSCMAAKAIYADEIIQKSPESGDLLKFSVRVINDKDSEMTILPGAVIQGESAFGDYKGIASISALDVEITGHKDVAFRNDKTFILPPFSIADITISVNADPAMIDPAADSAPLMWNYRRDGDPENYVMKELQQKDLRPADLKKDTDKVIGKSPEPAAAETGLLLFTVDPVRTQVPDPIPNFEPRW